ncbi:MAG: NAD-dependent epimerase/dehydratase family protein [Nanoarchaeota archaeon]|nr:NAD-dependent epimerase/dehydratase family protein [Nanoarchaeota archaeon]
MLFKKGLIVFICLVLLGMARAQVLQLSAPIDCHVGHLLVLHVEQEHAFVEHAIVFEIGQQGSGRTIAIGAEEYGIPLGVPIPEDHPLKPVSPYAKSKMLAEQLGKESAKRGFRVLLLRPFNHIGPGQSPDFAVSAFASQIAKIEKAGKPIIEVGNLESKRDFTDVRDVVRAYVTAFEKGDSGEPYNICSGTAYEMKEILEKLLAMSKKKVEIKKDPARMRSSDIPILLGDNRKFFRKTGWRPMIPIDDSLHSVLEYWRHRK